jgi:hypothetical protein
VFALAGGVLFAVTGRKTQVLPNVE